MPSFALNFEPGGHPPAVGVLIAALLLEAARGDLLGAISCSVSILHLSEGGQYCVDPFVLYVLYQLVAMMWRCLKTGHIIVGLRNTLLLSLSHTICLHIAFEIQLRSPINRPSREFAGDPQASHVSV